MQKFSTEVADMQRDELLTPKPRDNNPARNCITCNLRLSNYQNIPGTTNSGLPQKSILKFGMKGIQIFENYFPRNLKIAIL